MDDLEGRTRSLPYGGFFFSLFKHQQCRNVEGVLLCDA